MKMFVILIVFPFDKHAGNTLYASISMTLIILFFRKHGRVQGCIFPGDCLLFYG